MMTRREALKVSAAAVLVPATASLASADETPPPFTLPKLPYAADALEPHIDAQTMEIHHGKHHKAYVDNLNAALKGHADWDTRTLTGLLQNLSKLPESIRVAVRNNSGGHWNHTHFWSVMAPAGKTGKASSELAKAIDDSFGSLEKFQAAFADAGMKRFGSSWVWLVKGKDKPLAIVSSPNQDNPLMDGAPAPILGLDVWEHAYYLKYKNVRADYIKAWWNVVNWDAVSENFVAAMK